MDRNLPYAIPSGYREAGFLRIRQRKDGQNSIKILHEPLCGEGRYRKNGGLGRGGGRQDFQAPRFGGVGVIQVPIRLLSVYSGLGVWGVGLKVSSLELWVQVLRFMIYGLGGPGAEVRTAGKLTRG